MFPTLITVFCLLSYYQVFCDDQAILTRLAIIELELQECQTNYQVVTETIEYLKIGANETKLDLIQKAEFQEETQEYLTDLKSKVNNLINVTDISSSK